MDKVLVSSLSKNGPVSNKYFICNRIFTIQFIIYFYKEQNAVFVAAFNAVELVIAACS